MALIPQDRMAVLISAAEAKSVADEADYLHEEMQLAAVINNAANTGCHTAKYQHPMSNKLKERAKALGYVVTEKFDAAVPNTIYIISGF